MSRICVIGLCGMSFFLHMNRLPLIGETMHSNRLIIEPGGKGANQAVALATLDNDVGFISVLGNDNFAHQCLEYLHQRRVTTSFLVSKKGPTPMGVIGVDSNGHNMVMVHSEKEVSLAPDDVSSAYDYICGMDAVLLQLEVPLAANLEALRIAHTCGLRVFLNAAPFTEGIDKLLVLTDIVVLNEVEAKQAAGSPPNSAMRTYEDDASRILDLGPSNVIITLGAEGAFYKSRCLEGKVQPPQVCAVDTTGAGDTFMAALVDRIQKAYSLDRACEWAVHAAALSVGREGVMTTFPKSEEVEKLLVETRQE